MMRKLPGIYPSKDPPVRRREVEPNGAAAQALVIMKKIIGFAIEGHRHLGPIFFLASQRYHENASAAGVLATHCPQFLQ
jgi:hypothetical protein